MAKGEGENSPKGLIKADDKPIVQSDLENLRLWAEGSAPVLDDPGNLRALEHISVEDPSRQATFVAFSRMTRFRRMNELTNRLQSVDEAIEKKIPQMGARTLMEYRDRLKEDQRYMENSFLGENMNQSGRPSSPVQVNVMAQGGAAMSPTLPAESPRDAERPLNALSRQRVQQAALAIIRQSQAPVNDDSAVIVDVPTNGTPKNGAS